jgi:hypothetical protein
MYQAFGLRILSPLALPELPATPDTTPADVVLRFASAPTSLAGGAEAEPFIETAGNVCLVKAPVARFLVSGGQTVEIDCLPGASEADLRLYLLGSVFSLICHQRGLLPLHASAVAACDGAIAFSGVSGAGKSTLAVGLEQLGFPVLCDDLCAVGFGGARPVVQPGVARLKLWRDSLALIGVPSEGLERVAPSVDKYVLPSGPVVGVAGPGPLPLRGLYLLGSKGEGRRLARVRGARAFAGALAGVHRWPTAVALGLSRRVFDQLARLVGSCAVYEFVGHTETATPHDRQQSVLGSFEAIREGAAASA